MEFVKPEKYITRVSDKYYVSENERFLLIHLELIDPDRLNFVAGQYVSIKVNERGERRSYSIASTSDIDHAIMIVAELVPNGKGSEYLKKIKIGEEIEILGPLGRFVVEANAGDKLLYLATGSGIVPIKSMIEDLLIVKHDTRQIRLHWGMRREEDLFWFDNFERLAEEHPNFIFDQVISQPSASWELCSGHEQDCLTRDFPQGLSDWEAYVCGSPDAVNSIEQKLIEMKITEDKIHKEKFS